MRSTVGYYRGVKWRRVQLSEMFPHIRSAYWVYAVQDEKGRFTGDHFATQTEMRTHLDEVAKANEGRQ